MRIDMIREGVSKISDYSSEKWQFQDDMTINVDGTTLPLLPWRFDRRLCSVRKLVIDDNVLRKACSYKSRFVGNCSDEIRTILYQELDICEWLLDDKIISVYTQAAGDKILSMILKTEKGILCNIEIALTLSENTPPVTKHEITGKEGLVCDRSINEQIPVEAIYVFGQEGKKEAYTDMDGAMLGLTPDEVRIADNIIEWLEKSPDGDTLQKTTNRINYLVDCVFQSVKTGDIVRMEEK
ncbi:MAG: hypothetical protein IJO74_04080 [Clostridia bacterium]|nr:hypothetical protein [Clostridia bacterium]